MSPSLRIGIDLGGTKIAAVALGPNGDVRAERRIPSPTGDYGATIDAIHRLVGEMEQQGEETGSVGIGIPGSISPSTGLMQNANSTWLNGRPFDRDVEAKLGRAVRFANDANCFALSEATDGAAAGAGIVFGVILGTGCGGGLVHGGALMNGPRGITGEWGHTSLPWAAPDEHPGPACWCGRKGCMETWVSGPALSRDHERRTGEGLAAIDIAAKAGEGDAGARESLDRHASRLARGLAAVVNIVDPDVIVLGGGLSEMPHLYEALPRMAAPYVFADGKEITVRPPKHGAASGVRGAAWLWGKP